MCPRMAVWLTVQLSFPRTFDNSKPGRKLLIVFRVFKASGCGTVGYPFASFAGLGLFRFLLGNPP